VQIIKNDILQETENLMKIFVTSINTAEKKKELVIQGLIIVFLKTKKFILRSEATSLFDVQSA
jgi:hypothetical protein